MIMGKYGAVIGRKTHFLYASGIHFQAMGSFKPITAPYLTLIVKPRNLVKRQCKLRGLTPPTNEILSTEKFF